MRGEAFPSGKRRVSRRPHVREVSWWIGAVASVGVHLGLATWIARLPPSGNMSRPVTIALWPTTDTHLPEVPEPHGSVLAEARPMTWRPGGPQDPESVDAFDPGQGGDGRALAEAVRLANRTDAIRLQDAPMNTVGVAQLQRIRTARDRATREDRRATPRPMELLFLASGEGIHAERRPSRPTDPRTGARSTPSPSAAFTEGGAAQARPTDVSMSGSRALGSPRASQARPTPDRGIAAGRGRVRSDAARVATGRPPVDQGAAATPTDWSSARVRDNQDAELLAAQMQQALVDATPHAGRTRAAGIGGAGGGGAAGLGDGDAEGGRTRAWASAPGDFDARDPSDARYRRWLLDLRGKIGRALRYPDERRLALDQGTSVYRVILRRDGTVERAPRLLRSSGFSDLDAAARAAIDASLPLPPIPPDVAEGMTEIAVTLPIQFLNPMFR